MLNSKVVCLSNCDVVQKEIAALTGFEPVTSVLPAFALQRSTYARGADQFIEFIHHIP